MYQRLKNIFLFVFAFMFLAVHPLGFANKDSEKSKSKDSDLNIAYVSINECVEKTGEQKKMFRQLEKQQKKIQSVIRKKSEEYQKRANQLRKDVVLLSEEEKLKKYEEMQKMQLSLEQFVKTKELEFQKMEANMRKEVLKRITNVVSRIARREKVSVIRNRDGALWVSPRLDLTDKVIFAYKKKHKMR